MRRAVYWITAVLLVGGSLWAHGQDADPKADIQKKLSSQFNLTKTTADGSDIVTAGSVLVLRKDGFELFSTAIAPMTSNYKDGKISIGLGNTMSWNARLPSGVTAASVPKRKFVAGEKFWVTGIEVQNDGVIFQIYSDPYNGLRYWGRLKFGFSKKSIPPADDLLKTIAEVLTVEPNNNASENASQQEPKQAPEQALAPIAPPPPPADMPPPPKTISLGQTRDEVVAILGQPQKVVKLPTKEMLYYPDMKITLVQAKVTDVQ